MMIFDASAIFAAISRGDSEKMFGQGTSTLASFELGNIIWKEGVLARRFSVHDGQELCELCQKILERMHVSHPAMEDVYALAARFKITFYDAAYLALAAEARVPLITLDQHLAVAAAHVVEKVSFDDAMTRLNN